MFSRSTWFLIHSWVGVKLAILLCFIVTTGTLAVVSHEIDWLANPAKRVSPSSVSGMNWQAVYAQALSQSATLTFSVERIESIQAPIHAWFSAEVIYRDKENKRHRLFFHPSTGEYLGNGRWLNWQRFFRMVHRHLMLPLTLGITIVSIFGLAILAILISSLYIYRRWWKGFFRKPRWGHRQTRWGDLHRVAGVWSLWFLLVIGVTGTWYLAERWGAAAPSNNQGYAVTAKAVNGPVMPSQKALAVMLQKAHVAFPTLHIQGILFPQKARGVVELQGQASALLVRNRANIIQFDPVSANAVFQQDANDLALHVRISEAADPLHFGVWGGIQGDGFGRFVSKLLYFFFGIILTGLCLTGTYMYGMRTARLHRKEPNAKGSKPPLNHSSKSLQTWNAALIKMGVFAWFFATGVISVIAYSGYIFL